MFLAKKIITPFLLPPGFFIVILLISSFWLWRNRRSGIAIINFILGVMLWGLSASPVSDLLMQGLEKEFTIPRPLKGDVIILLGGGIHDQVPDLTGKGTPSSDMNGRILTAVRAHRQLKTPIIISGGTVFAGRSAEAPVVRRFLLDLGVPDKQILIEAKSRDTVENALFSKEIIDRNGFKHPLLVTSAYHMRRSIVAFKKAGVAVTPLPAQFFTGNDLPYIWADYLPSSSSLLTSATALREYLGLLFYKITG